MLNIPHDPLVAQSTYNVNELRFLDHYEQPRCYVMYVMTNLRHHSFFLFFSYNAQHQQADDFGIWGAHAEGVICGKIGKYVE